MRMLVFAGFLTLSAVSTAAQEGVSLDWVRPEGSPIKQLRTQSNLSYIHDVVVLANESDKVIDSFVVATAIIPPGPDAPSEWVRSTEITLSPMRPRVVYSMFHRMLPTSRLDAAVKKYGSGLTTETAVVEVRYADGTRWSFDTAGRRSISGKR